MALKKRTTYFEFAETIVAQIGALTRLLPNLIVFQKEFGEVLIVGLVLMLVVKSTTIVVGKDLIALLAMMQLFNVFKHQNAILLFVELPFGQP